MPPLLYLHDLAPHCKGSGDIHPKFHFSKEGDGGGVQCLRTLFSVLSGDHCAVCTEMAQFMQSDYFSPDLFPGEGSLTSKA